MKIFFTLLILTFVHYETSVAQFSDSFNDHNFTEKPGWSGDDGNFTAIDAKLRLQSPAITSTSYLCTPSKAINNASWEFYVQLDFNPSGTNLARVYLVSDKPNLTTSLNGYFVKIGNTADEVSLYRQDGTTEVKIIDGTDKTLNTASVKIRIKVTRDASGYWQLQTDVGLTGLYFLEGSVMDNSYVESSFFGIHCKYTATRSDRFYFDDFIVSGSPFVDVIAPKLQQIKVVSSNELELSFSEKISKASAESTLNYHADHELGNPATAALFPDQQTVRISFTQSFPNGVMCTLSASGISDISSNVMDNTTAPFRFFKPAPQQWRDVVITEIYADPSPSISLPAVEYVEVYNRGLSPVDLLDWKFTDGSSTGILSSYILLPDEYIILTSAQNVGQFTAPNSIGLPDFPTLNNTGDVLVLKNADDVTIDSVNYNDTWYLDDDKKQGGWSLERIDPNNLCAEAENWIASEDGSGGTPGKQNSRHANMPDLTGPKLIRAIPVSASDLLLTFNEKLERILPEISALQFEPARRVKTIGFYDGSLTSLRVVLNDPIKSQTEYSLVVNAVYDCAGNAIQPGFNTIHFGLPEKQEPLDVVFNEILFNPRPTAVDFIEIYNRSDKYINLKNWSTASYIDGILDNNKTITTTDFLLKPAAYLVITNNKDVLIGEYPLAREDNILVTLLPPLNDDEGSVALLDSAGEIVDHFQYQKEMHSIFIKDDEGVSLERIDVNQPTDNNQNWQSASAAAGFATPGYANSNLRPGAHLSEEAVQVIPEIFIPTSGNNDFTQIHYNFDQGGYVANVKIYDSEGREIKQLVNNTTLSTQGSFRWGGDTNKGNKAGMGYYVVWFEVFDAHGRVKTYRRRVIVGTQF